MGAAKRTLEVAAQPADRQLELLDAGERRVEGGVPGVDQFGDPVELLANPLDVVGQGRNVLHRGLDALLDEPLQLLSHKTLDGSGNRFDPRRVGSVGPGQGDEPPPERRDVLGPRLQPGQTGFEVVEAGLPRRRVLVCRRPRWCALCGAGGEDPLEEVVAVVQSVPCEGGLDEGTAAHGEPSSHARPPAIRAPAARHAPTCPMAPPTTLPR